LDESARKVADGHLHRPNRQAGGSTDASAGCLWSSSRRTVRRDYQALGRARSLRMSWYPNVVSKTARFHGQTGARLR
jgi:hypothetical protein